MVLLQAILGMDDESLMQDYELTSFGIWGWRSRNSEFFGKLTAALNQWGTAEEPMRVKAECFLLEGGVTPEQIAEIRKIFLI